MVFHVRITSWYEATVRPQDMLRAGIPMPAFPGTQGSWRESRDLVGTVEEDDHGARAGEPSETLEDYLRRDDPPEVMGSRSLVVREGDGTLLGAVYTRSSQYLSRPEPHRAELRRPSSVERSDHGFLVASYEATHTYPVPSRRPEPVDLTTARIVTFDQTVLFEGIDPAKFGESDVFFISAALAIDIAVLGDRRPGNEVWGTSWVARDWELTTPVPVDRAVIEVFKRLCEKALKRDGSSRGLDRTDLLCAATAIVYEAPLYTTKPDAYRPLKNGLKTLEYGRTRAKGDPTITEALRPAFESLRARYDQGGPFDEEEVRQARYDGNDFVDVLIHILEDDNLDPSWRVGILRMAREIRGSVRRCRNRPELFDAVSVLAGASGPRYDRPDDSLMAEQRALANEAIGWWGYWPDDAHPDVLRDMERDPTNEESLLWFRRYLQMASVPEAVREEEVRKVAEGSALPTVDYIHELQVEHGWA
jgi:predicted nucleic acid-binding protein